MADILTESLQQSVLTLLAVNSKEGRIASGLIDATAFDDTYRNIAERVLAFHKKHGTCPGKDHLDDLLDDVLEPNHKLRKQHLRILDGILSQADGLNAGYVLSRISEFSRRQQLKAAILEAGEVYQAGRESVVSDVESILSNALRPVNNDLDTGTFLNDKKRALSFLDATKADYMTGIPELDHRNLGPTHGEMLMLMAAKGAGKSWWCVDLAKRCLMQNARVLHVTLEMSEARVTQRYFQNFFAIGKRNDQFIVTDFEFDKLQRVSGFTTRKRRPRMTLDSPDIHKYLLRKQQVWGTKLGRLLIKGFPTKSLTVQRLDSYLDLLELRHNFIPNVLIVDYPDLMHQDKENPRISLGITIEELRGLLQKRNLAGIMPTQTNRAGWEATTVKGSMVSEDASKFRTADMVLIYSRTPEEKNRNLARLYVEKNRNDEGEFTVAISQAYTTGQFVLNSTRMVDNKNYFEVLGANASNDADRDREGDNDEDKE